MNIAGFNYKYLQESTQRESRHGGPFFWMVRVPPVSGQAWMYAVGSKQRKV